MRVEVLGLAVLFAGLVESAFGATITQGFFDISGTIYVTNPEATPVVTPAGTCPANQACILWQDSNAANDQMVDIWSRVCRTEIFPLPWRVTTQPISPI